MTPNYYNWS